MLINKNTKIIGQKCMLVPYRKEHVVRYHSWMQSEELQHLTASEPLSIEEEYEMQNSWMVDENKCTFIVLDKETYNRTNDEIESMIGDTNLFFSSEQDRICAEAEIMIAESWARGRKCGKEAMILMLLYGISHLSVKQFVVKILEDNEISIKLFESFGFVEVERSAVFKEVTLCKIVDEQWTQQLKNIVGLFEIVDNKPDE